jgi:C1A family cysteine protease
MSIILILTLFQGVDLEALQNALKERGNPWVAGTTSVSELSREEKQEMCGSRTPDLFEQEKSVILNMPQTESAYDRDIQMPPLTWDWRDHGGHNWMTPVKSQEYCGSCYLFAVVGGFEARLKIANNCPDTNIDLSEQFAICCDIRNYACHGGKLYASALFIVERGLPDEACYPYKSRLLPCINACPDWESRATKADSWGATFRVQEYKARIMEGPMACWLTPKADFFYYKDGVYTPVMGEKYVHATTLCGWNDTLGAWLFKNSWGTTWGDNGYGWINYGEEHIVGPGYPIWLEIEGGKLQLDVVHRDYASDETNDSARDEETAHDCFDHATERRADHAHARGLVISPDPSRFSISLRFQLSKIENVRIDVYDVAGKPVSCLVNDTFHAGDHKIVWNRTNKVGKNLEPGVYFFRLKSSSNDYVRKAILL